MCGYKKYRKAASLVEVMVAVAVLVVALVGLLATFVYCLAWSESNNNMVTAAIDAQSVMEEIKDADWEDISGSFVPQKTYDRLAQESIAVSVNEEVRGKEVTVQVSWVERTRTRTFSLISFFVP